MTVVQDESSYSTEIWTVVSMEEAEDIVRTDREGAYWVKWTRQLELDNTIQIEFPGIPTPISVISPKRLDALFPPCRIRMQFHPSWQELRDSLYDRTKTNYTHQELFFITQCESLIERETGLYLKMPNGGEPGGWEGDSNDLSGCSEHKEFWKEYHEKYNAWTSWGESLGEVVAIEIREFINDEIMLRSYYGRLPDTEYSLQKLGDRVRAGMAKLPDARTQSTRYKNSCNG